MSSAKQCGRAVVPPVESAADARGGAPGASGAVLVLVEPSASGRRSRERSPGWTACGGRHRHRRTRRRLEPRGDRAGGRAPRDARDTGRAHPARGRRSAGGVACAALRVGHVLKCGRVDVLTIRKSTRPRYTSMSAASQSPARRRVIRAPRWRDRPEHGLGLVGLKARDEQRPPARTPRRSAAAAETSRPPVRFASTRSAGGQPSRRLPGVTSICARLRPRAPAFSARFSRADVERILVDVDRLARVERRAAPRRSRARRSPCPRRAPRAPREVDRLQQRRGTTASSRDVPSRTPSTAASDRGPRPRSGRSRGAGACVSPEPGAGARAPARPTAARRRCARRGRREGRPATARPSPRRGRRGP